MTQLDDSIRRIRQNAGAFSDPSISADSADSTSADALYLAQAQYAVFGNDLKAAMKTAAKRWDWDKETWILQTELIAQALQTGCFTEEQLAADYQRPPPDGGYHAA